MDNKSVPIISQVGYNRTANNMLAFHLAGIIPVNGFDESLQMPWSDCLMPISEDLLLIEKSVMECVYAGCNTIWIVCNDDISSLIKKRLGEWVYSTENRITPIYYVPVNSSKNRQKKNLTYSLLYGMLVSYWVTKKLSTWMIPIKFYLSFPMSFYPIKFLKKNRREIKNERRTFYLSYQNKTFADGELLGCTIPFNDFLVYWKRWKTIFEEKKNKNNKSLIGISEVFDVTDERIIKLSNTSIVEVSDFVNIVGWKEYLIALAEKRDLLSRDNVIFSMEGKRFFKDFEKESQKGCPIE